MKGRIHGCVNNFYSLKITTLMHDFCTCFQKKLFLQSQILWRLRFDRFNSKSTTVFKINNSFINNLKCTSYENNSCTNVTSWMSESFLINMNSVYLLYWCVIYICSAYVGSLLINILLMFFAYKIFGKYVGNKTASMNLA